MFEWVFADVLGGYLEKYVVDFSSHNFRLAAWNGDIILKDLELRTDLLDTADLPVQVVRGRIGSLRIQVPWKSLWSAPVVMMIGNVDVQTEPRDESWSEDLEAKMKQSKLAAWEATEKIAASMTEAFERHAADARADQKRGSLGFFARLTTAIVDNLQISVASARFTYRDAVSNPHLPFEFGLQLESLTMHSTNASWRSSFADSGDPVINKLVKVTGLCIYSDFSASFQNQSSSDRLTHTDLDVLPVREQAASSPRRGASANKATPYGPGAGLDAPSIMDSWDMILEPIDLTAKLALSRDYTDVSRPWVSVDFEIPELNWVLQERQYLSALDAAEFHLNYEKRFRNSKNRPDRPIRKNTRAWWQWAYERVVETIQVKRSRNTLAYITRRRHDRRRYIALYLMQSGGSLRRRGARVLEEMEERLSYEDIVYFRSLAKAQERVPEAFPSPMSLSEVVRESGVGAKKRSYHKDVPPLTGLSPYASSSSGLTSSASPRQLDEEDDDDDDDDDEDMSSPRGHRGHPTASPARRNHRSRHAHDSVEYYDAEDGLEDDTGDENVSGYLTPRDDLSAASTSFQRSSLVRSSLRDEDEDEDSRVADDDEDDEDDDDEDSASGVDYSFAPDDDPEPGEEARPQRQGWGAWIGSWVWGSGAKATQSDDQAQGDSVVGHLTEEQRAALFKGINYDPSEDDDLFAQAREDEEPPENDDDISGPVQLVISFKLGKGSLKLMCSNQHDPSATARPFHHYHPPGRKCSKPRRELVNIVVSDMAFDLETQDNTVRGLISLSDFAIMNPYTPGTAFPALVHRKQVARAATPLYSPPTTPTAASPPATDARSFAASPPPGAASPTYPRISVVRFVSRGTNRQHLLPDLEVSLHVEQLEIVYDPLVISRVARFLSPPYIAGQELDVAAFNQRVRDLRSRTRAKLEYVWNNALTVGLDVNIKAPVLVIPEDTHRADGQTIELHLGSLAVLSDSKRQGLIKRHRHELEKLAERFPGNDGFYDHYTVRLSNLSVVMRGSQNGSQEVVHLVEPINATMDVMTCLLAADDSMTKFKVRCQMSAVNVRLTDHVIERIVSFAKVASRASDAPTASSLSMSASQFDLSAVTATSEAGFALQSFDGADVTAFAATVGARTSLAHPPLTPLVPDALEAAVVARRRHTITASAWRSGARHHRREPSTGSATAESDAGGDEPDSNIEYERSRALRSVLDFDLIVDDMTIDVRHRGVSVRAGTPERGILRAVVERPHLVVHDRQAVHKVILEVDNLTVEDRTVRSRDRPFPNFLEARASSGRPGIRIEAQLTDKQTVPLFRPRSDDELPSSMSFDLDLTVQLGNVHAFSQRRSIQALFEFVESARYLVEVHELDDAAGVAAARATAEGADVEAKKRTRVSFDAHKIQGTLVRKRKAFTVLTVDGAQVMLSTDELRESKDLNVNVHSMDVTHSPRNPAIPDMTLVSVTGDGGEHRAVRFSDRTFRQVTPVGPLDPRATTHVALDGVVVAIVPSFFLEARSYFRKFPTLADAAPKFDDRPVTPSLELVRAAKDKEKLSSSDLLELERRSPVGFIDEPLKFEPAPGTSTQAVFEIKALPKRYRRPSPLPQFGDGAFLSLEHAPSNAGTFGASGSSEADRESPLSPSGPEIERTVLVELTKCGIDFRAQTRYEETMHLDLGPRTTISVGQDTPVPPTTGRGADELGFFELRGDAWEMRCSHRVRSGVFHTHKMIAPMNIRYQHGPRDDVIDHSTSYAHVAATENEVRAERRNMLDSRDELIPNRLLLTVSGIDAVVSETEIGTLFAVVEELDTVLAKFTGDDDDEELVEEGEDGVKTPRKKDPWAEAEARITAASTDARAERPVATGFLSRWSPAAAHSEPHVVEHAGVVGKKLFDPVYQIDSRIDYFRVRIVRRRRTGDGTLSNTHTVPILGVDFDDLDLRGVAWPWETLTCELEVGEMRVLDLRPDATDEPFDVILGPTVGEDEVMRHAASHITLTFSHRYVKPTKAVMYARVDAGPTRILLGLDSVGIGTELLAFSHTFAAAGYALPHISSAPPDGMPLDPADPYYQPRAVAPFTLVLRAPHFEIVAVDRLKSDEVHAPAGILNAVGATGETGAPLTGSHAIHMRGSASILSQLDGGESVCLRTEIDQVSAVFGPMRDAAITVPHPFISGPSNLCLAIWTDASVDAGATRHLICHSSHMAFELSNSLLGLLISLSRVSRWSDAATGVGGATAGSSGAPDVVSSVNGVGSVGVGGNANLAVPRGEADVLDDSGRRATAAGAAAANFDAHVSPFADAVETAMRGDSGSDQRLWTAVLADRMFDYFDEPAFATVDVTLHKVQLLVVEATGDIESPVFQIQIKNACLGVIVVRSSKRLSVSASAGLSAHYHNTIQGCWDEFVHGLTLTMTGQRPEEELSIFVSSPRTIDIPIAADFVCAVDAFLQALDISIAAAESVRGIGVNPYVSSRGKPRLGRHTRLAAMAPKYKIQNFTGHAIRYGLEGHVKRTLAHDELGLLDHWPECWTIHKGRRQLNAVRMEIEVHGMHPLHNVRIDQARVAHHKLIPLREAERSGFGPRTIVVDVQLVGSTRLITVRSPIRFRNMTSVPLMVRLEPAMAVGEKLYGGGLQALNMTAVDMSTDSAVFYPDLDDSADLDEVVPEGVIQHGPVLPGEYVSVPVGATAHRIRLRVAGDTHQWSRDRDIIDLATLPNLAARSVRLRSIEKAALNCVLNVVCRSDWIAPVVGRGRQALDVTVEAHAPLHVENMLPWEIALEVFDPAHPTLVIEDLLRVAPGAQVPIYGTNDTIPRFRTIFVLDKSAQLDHLDAGRTISGSVNVSLTDAAAKNHVHLQMSTRRMRDKTCIVTFAAPYWFVNRSGADVIVKMGDERHGVRIPRDRLLASSFEDDDVTGQDEARMPFAKDRMVRLRMDETGYSDPFSLSDGGPKSVIKSSDAAPQMHPVMRVAADDFTYRPSGSFRVSVAPETVPGFGPARLVVITSEYQLLSQIRRPDTVLAVRQVDMPEETSVTLFSSEQGARNAWPWQWGDALGQRRLQVRRTNRYRPDMKWNTSLWSEWSSAFALDSACGDGDDAEAGCESEWPVHLEMSGDGGPDLLVDLVDIEGTTCVVFSEVEPKKVLGKVLDEEDGGEPAAPEIASPSEPSNRIRLTVTLPSVDFLLLNAEHSPFASFEFVDVSLRYMLRDDDSDRTVFSIDHGQAKNQLPVCRFPVLARSVHTVGEPSPLLHVEMVRTSADLVKYFGIGASRLEVIVDMEWVFKGIELDLGLDALNATRLVGGEAAGVVERPLARRAPTSLSVITDPQHFEGLTPGQVLTATRPAHAQAARVECYERGPVAIRLLLRQVRSGKGGPRRPDLAAISDRMTWLLSDVTESVGIKPILRHDVTMDYVLRAPERVGERLSGALSLRSWLKAVAHSDLFSNFGLKWHSVRWRAYMVDDSLNDSARAAVTIFNALILARRLRRSALAVVYDVMAVLGPAAESAVERMCAWSITSDWVASPLMRPAEGNKIESFLDALVLSLRTAGDQALVQWPSFVSITGQMTQANGLRGLAEGLVVGASDCVLRTTSTALLVTSWMYKGMEREIAKSFVASSDIVRPAMRIRPRVRISESDFELPEDVGAAILEHLDHGRFRGDGYVGHWFLEPRFSLLLLTGAFELLYLTTRGKFLEVILRVPLSDVLAVTVCDGGNGLRLEHVVRGEPDMTHHDNLACSRRPLPCGDVSGITQAFNPVRYTHVERVAKALQTHVRQPVVDADGDGAR